MFQGQKGQTLVEVMTVMFVLAVGIMGALGLTSANVKNEHKNLTRLIASNLAREGVELARSLRDSNWLKGDLWDTGVGSDSEGCALVKDSFSSFEPLDCSTFGELRSDTYRVYKDSNGMYLQNKNGPQVGNTQTTFYRKINFEPVCDAVPCSWALKVGIRVISEVGWADKGDFRTLKAIEDLYNWR